MSLTALEPFFKDSSPCRLVLGYPHTLPHMGRGADFKSSFVHKGFVAFCALYAIPDFGRFCRSRGCRAARGQEAVLAQNLPRRSRDKRVHPRTGYIVKGQGCPFSV